MKRKILMALMGLEIGGAETHVVELSKELSRQGNEILVVSNGGVYEKELTSAGIRCFHAPMHRRNPFLMLRSLLILGHIIRKEKPDVVHAHARIPAFLCGILRTFLHFPFVTSAHWVFYTNSALRILTNWGQRTIAVSEDIKSYLIDNYGIDSNHIFVTINGIDTEKFSPKISGDAVRAEFGLDPKKPTISYVSRLDESRALVARQLIEITPRLKEKIPDLQILIAGSGDVFDELRMKADAVNQSLGCSCIKMAGARTDINEIVAVGDLFIGVSRAALEAMSAEKPVIVAGNEGYIGLFSEDKLSLSQESNFCCRGCPPPTEGALEKDIIDAFNLSKDELIELGKYGRQVIFEYYSVRRMAADCLTAYQQIWHHPHILMSGYYGFDNLGDEAILLSIKRSLSALDSDTAITVLSNNPQQTQLHYNVQAVPRFEFWKVLHALQKCDVLLSGGGSLLQDHTSTRSLLYYLLIIWGAKLFRKPVMLYANGIGPVSGKNNRKLMKYIIDRVDMITLREEASKAELIAMGVTNKQVFVTADPVYSLPGLSQPEALQKLADAGIPTDKALLGISVRDTSGMIQNLDSFAQFFDQIAKEFELLPVFLIMQTPKDIQISKALAKRMQTTSYIFESSFDPQTMLGVIGCMKVILSTRLHTLIFAAKQRVPLMGFVYDPKVQACLDMLDMPSGGRPESFDPTHAIHEFRKLLARDTENQKKFSQAVSELERLAGKNEELLISLTKNS